MKYSIGFAIGLVFSVPAFADFFDYHETLFRNQSLCDDRMADQVHAERNFRRMFEILRQDDVQGRRSKIEVEDYLAYSTRLKDKTTGSECSIIVHEDCYSAYCK